jgi:hypothetical protein
MPTRPNDTRADSPRPERSLHLLLEAKMQSVVHVLPGLTSLLAAAYVMLHVTVTAAVLGFTHPHSCACCRYLSKS